jgi:hypothetical protein
MNERIKELAREAGAVFTDVHAVSLLDDEIEKFAELIVRECMKVAVFKDSGYMHTADVAGYMAAGRSTAARMIKEHFGVEE